MDDVLDYYRDLIRLGEDSDAMKESGRTALPAFSEVFTSHVNGVYRKTPLRALQPQTMLADGSHDVHSGRLDRDTHLSLASKRAILDFITQELPRWRDDPQRPTELAETRLTEHLCDYLNSATYFSNDWSHIQIRTETADEAQAGRKMDLAIKPRGTELIIERRRVVQIRRDHSHCTAGTCIYETLITEASTSLGDEQAPTFPADLPSAKLPAPNDTKKIESKFERWWRAAGVSFQRPRLQSLAAVSAQGASNHPAE